MLEQEFKISRVACILSDYRQHAPKLAGLRSAIENLAIVPDEEGEIIVDVLTGQI